MGLSLFPISHDYTLKNLTKYLHENKKHYFQKLYQSHDLAQCILGNLSVDQDFFLIGMSFYSHIFALSFI